MTSAGIPGRVWTWRSTILVLAVLLAPVLSLSFYLTEPYLLASLAHLGGLILGPACLVASVASYAAWQMNPRPGLAWATIGLAVLGAQELTRTAVRLATYPEPVPGVWAVATDGVSALLLAVGLSFAHFRPRRPDPAATGFALGGLASVLILAWQHAIPDLGPGPARAVVSAVQVALVLSAAGLLIWGAGLTPRIGSIPHWARLRTAVAVVLIGGAHLALYLGDNEVAHATVVLGYTVAAVLLVSTYLAVATREVDATHATLSHLSDEVLEAGYRIRDQKSRLHEVKSTVAGIASASELLRSDRLDAQRRVRLADMMSAELGRLERLLTAADQTSEARIMDLDETISTLVVSHEARGHQISWSPSGVRVMAQPDAVAAVLNVLLSNAAKHGRSPAEVTVTQTLDAVEVAVRDDGPGVREALRTRIFAWGARGSESDGQGIGLHVARELAERQGGYLEIRNGTARGSTFVMGLPLACRHQRG